METRPSPIWLLAISLALTTLPAMLLPAHAVSIGPVVIEITDESFNLVGEGAIPLGDGYAFVGSKVTVKEHPTKTSTIQSMITFNELDFFLPIGSISTTPMVVFTVDSSLELFPLIEITDHDPAGDPTMNPAYAGTLGPTVTIDPTDPLTAMSSDEISIDFSSADPNSTIVELFISGFDFSTLTFSVNNLSMSSDPLTFKQDLGQNVGGGAEDDFIELTIAGLTMGDAVFDINELLSIDIFSPTLDAEFEFPTLVVNGSVADISTDPPFGPISLTSVFSEASVPEPGVISLMAIGLLAMAGIRGRH
jgi:hypothetical protein